jgi:exoribonuclease-2
MIKKNSLVIYKNKAALVKDEGEKIMISVLGEKSDGKLLEESVKVREKDVELIHPGPLASLKELENLPCGDVESSWELLEGSSVSLKELAELVFGDYTPQSAWAAFLLLKDGLYFTGNSAEIKPREKQQVEDEQHKRREKEREQTERTDFLNRLKAKKLQLPDDGRFLQDVEALAYGKSDKSRTLKDIGKSETPEEAHRLLLETHYWTPFKNPHPSRFGLTLTSAKTPINPPPADEDRIDLTHLRSFAIDNAWSADPDDAVSADGNVLWVHVADPAAAISPNSTADLEARGRGATLYLPEGAARMLNESALPLFALGLDSASPALSFKIELDNDGNIALVDICRSLVSVTRLTYDDVDKAIHGENEKVSPEDTSILKKLAQIAERNIQRRENLGAIAINMPEIHITVTEEHIDIESVSSYKSAEIVRECMLLAGEGASSWALQKRLPFPYVTQEVGDIPNEIPQGIVGDYQLRRCMRPRQLTSKPGLHAGLGIDGYTQVTSPLRRYTDLLAHQQIRAFLRGETPLSEDEILVRLVAGEAAASAVVHAERASKMYWLTVFLSEKKGSVWDAIVLEKKGPRVQIIIPALGLETQTVSKGDAKPGDEIQVAVSSCKIPESEIVMIQQ